MSNVYRRAALIVASLDRAAAQEVINRMPDEQAYAIRQELVSIQSTDTGERELEVARFLASNRAPDLANGRDDSADSFVPSSSLEAAISPAANAVSPEESVPAVGASLSDLLKQSDESIATHLMHERSSVVAALLSACPRNRAAGVLRELPAIVQSRVLVLLNLGVRTKSRWVEIVADVICDRHAETAPSPALNSSHQDALQAIMNELTPAEREQMLSDLEKENPMLAKRLNASTPASKQDCYC